MQETEELSAQLAGLEQQLADMTQAHNDLKCALVICGGFVGNKVFTLMTACMLFCDLLWSFASVQLKVEALSCCCYSGILCRAEWQG